jgi:integral membrane sensor domain MASE1
LAYLATNNCLEAVLGAILLRHFCRGVPDLGKLSHVLVFVTAGALFGTFITAASGAMWVSNRDQADYWLVMQTWWIADLLGVLVVAPIVIAYKNESVRSFRYSGWHILELMVLYAGFLIVLSHVFMTDFSQNHITFDQPYLAFPFLWWAALRFGARTLSYLTVIVAFLVADREDPGACAPA